MISYIQHDKEFYGVLKLSSGDDVIGTMICTEGLDESNRGTTIIFISNPAKMKQVEINQPDKQGVGVGLIKWQFFSEEEFYVVSEKDVISIAPLSRQGIQAYRQWLKQDFGIEEIEGGRPIKPDMGSRGKVSTARVLLEKLFNAPPHIKK